MADDLNKTDNELAVVHLANKKRLDHLEVRVKQEREATRDLLDEVDRLLESKGVRLEPASKPSPTPQSRRANLHIVRSWEETVARSKTTLHDAGISYEELRSYDLLSDDELRHIEQKLTRPMYDRIPWDRWDYFIAFAVGVLGGVLDVVAGTPGKFIQGAMADKNHWLGQSMEKVHNLHHSGAPIDYMGKNFGGKHHRGLSPGHDLLRFVEGIKQFKEGTFRGVYFENGKKILFSTTTNPQGYQYQTLSLHDAIWRYCVHMFCDFFSTTSLPIPGTSYLRESSDREIRVLAEKELYQQGINLRHVVMQGLPVAAIWCIVRLYLFFKHRNLDAPDEAKRQKTSELMLLANSISLSFNIGKIIITKNPLLLNAPQSIAVSKHLMKVIIAEGSRNSYIRKVQRNTQELEFESQELLNTLEHGIPESIIMGG